MLHESNVTTLTPRQARGGKAKGQPLTTLRPGERVIVNLRGRVSDRIHQWAGEVIDVDAVAVRLRPTWYRFGLSACDASGEDHVIPWSQIADVKVVSRKGDGNAT